MSYFLKTRVLCFIAFSFTLGIGRVHGENEISDFADELVKNGSKVIALLPKAIVMKKDGTMDTDGDKSTGKLGPRTDRYVVDMYKALSKAMKERGGKVLRPSQTRAKILSTDFDATDILDDDKMAELTKALNVDAVVYLEYDKDRDTQKYVGPKNSLDEELRIGVNKVDVLNLAYVDKDANEGQSGEMQTKVSLSTAAYSGDSWWIREWKGDKLVSREGAIANVAEKESQIGTGQEWEQVQFQYLNEKKATHPSFETGFPYPISFRVKNKATGEEETREIERFGNEAVLPLDDGEVFSVVIDNKTKRKVRIALILDGVCNIDGHENDDFDSPIMRYPHEFEQNQVYDFDPGKWSLRHWVSSQSGQLKDVGLFRAKTLDDPSKIGTTLLGNVGMITVVFFSAGNEGFEKPELDPDEIPDPTRSGFGASNAPDLFVEMQKIDPKLTRTGKAGKIGPIMAAATFYYRSRDVVAKAKQNGKLSPDDPIADFGETVLASKLSKQD